MALRDDLKILVVDDTSVSRALIVNAIEAMGIRQITTAKDGPSALRALGGAPVHLVVSDQNMPGMSGLDLLRKLRGEAATARTAFVLVTGRPDRALIEEGKKIGLNNFLPKPFESKDMKRCIEAVVGPV